MLRIDSFVGYKRWTKTVHKVIKLIKFVKYMKFNSFEEIISWKKSKQLTLIIYRELVNCRDFSFKDQIRRATISIMNNIAEGFERKGNKEFRNFLYIAKGSCAEVRSMLYLSQDFGYLNEKICQQLIVYTIEISKLLSGLIKTL